MKASLERISVGPSLASLGLPVLPSGAADWEWLRQERAIAEEVQGIASDTLSQLQADIPG